MTSSDSPNAERSDNPSAEGSDTPVTERSDNPVTGRSDDPNTMRLRAAWGPVRRVAGGSAGSAGSLRRPSWMFAGVALAVTTAVLVASLVTWRAAEDRATLAGNRTAATSAARASIEKMLGYDFKSFDRHTTEVSALLTGSFKNEFVQAATTTVKPLAVQNRVVVVAKASEVSVMSTPNLAGVKILAFVDQQTTSARLERPQIDQNRVILTMSQVDGRWLVAKVEAF